jgi:hypothetical protein
MAEETMLDAILKFLTGRFGQESIMRWGLVLSIILILAVVYSFFIKETSGSFEKYYEFKLERCDEVALATAQIATSDDEKVLREALARFDELYYGQLVIFEGRKLETAMIDFRDLLTTTSASPSVTSSSSITKNEDAKAKNDEDAKAKNEDANAKNKKPIEKDRNILYEAFRANRDDTKAAQLRQAALRVSAACYLEVTPRYSTQCWSD